MTDVAIPVARPEAEGEHAAATRSDRDPGLPDRPARRPGASRVVLVGLIVAIEVNKLWPLTFFHVAFGAAWTIIDLFLGLVLGRSWGRSRSRRESSSPPG